MTQVDIEVRANWWDGRNDGGFLRGGRTRYKAPRATVTLRSKYGGLLAQVQSVATLPLCHWEISVTALSVANFIGWFLVDA